MSCQVCILPNFSYSTPARRFGKDQIVLVRNVFLMRRRDSVTGVPRQEWLFAASELRRAVPHDQGALDPPFDFGRYVGELHTSLHAALAPTPRASQQPCRAIPRPALTMPARPSSHHAPCLSRRARFCRRAHSRRWTASSWTAWYGPAQHTSAGAWRLTAAAHHSRLPQGPDKL